MQSIRISRRLFVKNQYCFGPEKSYRYIPRLEHRCVGVWWLQNVDMLINMICTCVCFFQDELEWGKENCIQIKQIREVRTLHKHMLHRIRTLSLCCVRVRSQSSLRIWRTEWPDSTWTSAVPQTQQTTPVFTNRGSSCRYRHTHTHTINRHLRPLILPFIIHCVCVCTSSY